MKAEDAKLRALGRNTMAAGLPKCKAAAYVECKLYFDNRNRAFLCQKVYSLILSMTKGTYGFPTIIANSVKAEDAKPTDLKQVTVMMAGFPKRRSTNEKVDKLICFNANNF